VTPFGLPHWAVIPEVTAAIRRCSVDQFVLAARMAEGVVVDTFPIEQLPARDRARMTEGPIPEDARLLVLLEDGVPTCVLHSPTAGLS
jgi:hypothetical protein